MKILLLADPSSIHTIRWAKSLSSHGLIVSIFGLNAQTPKDYTDTAIKVYSAGIKPNGVLTKLRYLMAVRLVKKAIKDIKPDLVHAHYASSYGLLARLSGFKPFIISVWGSDIYQFPRKSFIHRKILEINVKSASAILSTSKIMAKETLKYVGGKSVQVTPFGIDLGKFRREKVDNAGQPYRIGTIKSLNAIYRIDLLIEAYAIVKSRLEIPLELVIVGDGPQEQELKGLARRLGVADSIKFVGKVAHERVPELLNTFAVFCALSDDESFGVAVIEASACELPVVVSDAPGLKEVVDNGVTGLVVQKNDAIAAAKAIQDLLINHSVRERMGQAGRRRVEQLFDWNENVNQMMAIYRRILQKE